MQRTHFFMTLGLIATCAFASPAYADHERSYGQNRGGTEIILYSDTNFRGQARVFYGDVVSLSGSGFNNEARSVEIRGGASWTLCEKSDGRGDCRTITRSIRDLGRIDLDCELTSFYQTNYGNNRGREYSGRQDDHGLRGGPRERTRGNRRSARSAVTLFTKDDFRGRSVSINGPVNLRDIGFDDKADSVSIQYGQWVACTRRDLEGRCKVLSRSVYDLDDIDLDDNISSIAPYNGNRRGARRRW